MSIIYEALKKLGKHPLQEKPEGAQSGTSSKITIMPAAGYILLAVLGMFIAKKAFDFFVPKSPAPSPAAQAPIASLPERTPADPSPPLTPAQPETPVEGALPLHEEPQEQYVLNGIFSSGNDNYALINNQIVRNGDRVADATVKKITLNVVELDTPEGPLELTNRR